MPLESQPKLGYGEDLNDMEISSFNLLEWGPLIVGVGIPILMLLYWLVNRKTQRS